MTNLYDVIVGCTSSLRTGNSKILESEVEKLDEIPVEDFRKTLGYISDNLRGLELNTVLAILDVYSKKYEREFVKKLVDETLKIGVPKPVEIALVGYA